MRFPWNIVKVWNVSSLASGNILIQPEYIDGRIPGVFTRMRLALWVSDRIVKRRAAEPQGASRDE